MWHSLARPVSGWPWLGRLMPGSFWLGRLPGSFWLGGLRPRVRLFGRLRVGLMIGSTMLVVLGLAAGAAAASSQAVSTRQAGPAMTSVSWQVSRLASRPAAGSYRPPLAGPVRVLRGFSPPATRYGAGHLGADLALSQGRTVLAAGTGVVRFAGQVAGRGLVVIAHPDGVSTEYEPLVPVVAAGVPVVAGQLIGRLAGQHRGCPDPGCLHWGARRNGQYLDPMGLLRPLGVVRLLPWDWQPP